MVYLNATSIWSGSFTPSTSSIELETAATGLPFTRAESIDCPLASGKWTTTLGDPARAVSSTSSCGN